MIEGAAEIRFGRRGGVTRLDHLYQRDPLRVLFPASAPNDFVLAILLTTSGRLEELDIAVDLAAGAAAHVTGAAPLPGSPGHLRQAAKGLPPLLPRLWHV